MNDERIEKEVLLRAPRERVWRALADSAEFGTWFGMAFEAPFVAGRRLAGSIRPTAVDPEIASLQAPHAGKRVELFIESLEPMHRLSFRWHPFAVDLTSDYSREPTTRVEFTLVDDAVGTLLRIVESGFERLPRARREAAFPANDRGWAIQCTLIAKYLAAPTAA